MLQDRRLLSREDGWPSALHFDAGTGFFVAIFELPSGLTKSRKLARDRKTSDRLLATVHRWPSGFHWDDDRSEFYARTKGESGKRERWALGKDFERAIRRFEVRKEEVADAALGLGSKARQRTPIQDILTRYNADIASRCSKAHAYNVRLSIEEVRAEIGAHLVSDLRLDAINDLKVQWSKTISARTVNKKLGHFVSALKWAERLGIIDRNPVSAFEKIPQGRKNQAKIRHMLTVKEARSLVRQARLDDMDESGRGKTVPQAPLLLTILATGLRFGEASKIRWGDIKKVKGKRRLHVQREICKTDDERFIPINDDTMAVLKDLRSKQGEVLNRLPKSSDLIFLSRRGRQWVNGSTQGAALRWLKKCGKAAKFPEAWPDRSTLDWYAIRHTFCQFLRDAGAPLRDAADLMGHKDEKITREIYSRVSRDDSRRQAGIDLIPKMEEEDDAKMDIA